MIATLTNTNSTEPAISSVPSESSICFQYCVGEEPYIQYGCLVAEKSVIDGNEWQTHIQKCLQHFFHKTNLLAKNKHIDIELYDNNVIVYDYRVYLSPCDVNSEKFNGDYNLYIDVPNRYYMFNGTKYSV